MSIEGRTDDILTFKIPGERSVRLFPLVLGMAIEVTPGVRRFQAMKTVPKTLSVRLEVEPGAGAQMV
jgi:phenylacetate-CoA ligase